MRRDDVGETTCSSGDMEGGNKGVDGTEGLEGNSNATANGREEEEDVDQQYRISEILAFLRDECEVQGRPGMNDDDNGVEERSWQRNFNNEETEESDDDEEEEERGKEAGGEETAMADQDMNESESLEDGRPGRVEGRNEGRAGCLDRVEEEQQQKPGDESAGGEEASVTHIKRVKISLCNVCTLALPKDNTRHMEGGNIAKWRIWAKILEEKGIDIFAMAETKTEGPWVGMDEEGAYRLFFSGLPPDVNRMWGWG